MVARTETKRDGKRQEPTHTSWGGGRGEVERGKHGQHWRISEPSTETSIVVVGRRLQTKMRLCDPLGSPATRVVSPSFPVASAREAPPRGD